VLGFIIAGCLGARGYVLLAHESRSSVVFEASIYLIANFFALLVLLYAIIQVNFMIRRDYTKLKLR
jgi:hypothetical protein